MKRFSLFALVLVAMTSVNGELSAFGGNVPTGLPGNFGIGSIDKNDNWNGDSTAPHRWKMGQSCFDYSYQYLTSGWRGWSTPDGQWPVNELTLWEGQGENQVFTFYYNSGAASLPTTWFGDLMVLMQKIEANSSKKVIIHIEPDFLGFCLQKGSGSYTASGIVSVGSTTAPTGWTGTGTKAWNITNYPDNLVGWAKAIRDMQTLVAPNHVLIAHHFTAWGASSGSSGDAFGQPTSQADIDNILTQIAAFLKNIGGGSYSYMDLFFMDPSDRDAAWYNQYNGGSNLRWSAENYSLTWGSRSWATLAYVADKASSLVGMRCMFWQMPNGNHFYKMMANTDGHYQDNYTQAFLPAVNSNGSSGAPGDAISASSTVSGPGFWANHGLIGVLFGEGYYAGTPPEGSTNLTHLRDYGPADGIITTGTFTSRGGPGGTSPGQGQATSTVSDNDGGYLRNAVAKYCSVGKFTLPGASAPTATPTPCNCSPTRTPTPTPAPADCSLQFNSCDSLTTNGTWGGSASTITLNTTGTYYDQGSGSVKVTVNTAAAFNANAAQLNGFTPASWAPYDRITMDVYVDPAHLLTTTASTWCNLSIALTGGTTVYYQQDPTVPSGSSTGTAAPLVPGWNHLSYPLYWGAANNNPAIVPTNLTTFFVIPNVGVAASGAVFYIDNIVLHTDAACPSATPTATYNPNTATPTPTPTRTPADCPLVLNNCDTLGANGVWTPSSGTAAVNTNAAYATSGNSMQFTVTSPATFQDKVSVLAGFTPTDWRAYDRITFDLYVDAANPLWSGTSGYNQFQLRTTNTTANQYEVDPTGGTVVDITTGWNHVTFPLSWATYSGNGITFLFLAPSVGTPLAGAVYYIDNIVLHSDTVCPPPTATSTISPTSTLTRTGTPTASPTMTASPSPTASATATPTLTQAAATPTRTSTASPTATGTATPSGTPSVTGSPTATRTTSPTATASPSVTLTATLPPAGSTATSTPSISPTFSVTGTPTYTATRTGTATATASVTAGSTATPSGTPAGTATLTLAASATPSFTVGLSATPSATQSPGPSATLSFTAGPSATPSGSPSPAATPTPSQTALPSATATASVTPPPPGSTATNTPSISPTFSATGTPSRTVTPTVTATRTAVPSVTLSATPSPSLPGASPTRTVTANPVQPSATATPTAGLIAISGGPASDQGGNLLLISGANLPAVPNLQWDGVALPASSMQVSVPGQAWLLVSPVEPVAGTHVITSYTAVGSLSVQIVVSPKATATPTLTPPPGGGTLVIESHHFYPNPMVGSGQGHFAIKLSGPAERVRLKVYTKALVAVGTVEFPAVQAGWVSMSLPSWLAGLPVGTYYYVVSAERGPVKAAQPPIGRLVVIK